MPFHYNDLRDLLLLVGTNPLPSYVVARFFLEKSSNLTTIWLIHSEDNKFQTGTKQLADNLKKCLKDLGTVEINMVSLQDVGSARKIREDLEQKFKKGCGIHLDYTGGTKVMSVHVYHYIKDKFERPSFSYLDARKYQLLDDADNILCDNLRSCINIKLDNLLRLHVLDEFKIGDALQNDSSRFFAEIARRGMTRIFLDWKNSDKKDWPKEFVDLEGELNLNVNQNELIIAGGSILEEYIYELLKMKIEEFDEEIRLYKSVVIKKAKKMFELDVVLIRGYQLTIISCTFSRSEKECKLKGFEVLHRANQVGGDESKAILLTCLPRETNEGWVVQRVYDDLKGISGSADDKLLVLGIDDLKEDVLWKKIKKHVWGEW